MRWSKNKHKRLLVCLLLIVAAGAAFWLSRPAAPPSPPPADAPAAEPETPTSCYIGKEGERCLEDDKGSLLLVNLWATWCPPCLAELPSLEKLQETYADRGLKVIAISLDQMPYENLEGIYARLPFNLPLYQDPQARLMERFNGRMVPFTAIINAEGEEIFHIPGERDWMAKEQTDLIEAHLPR